MRALRAACRAAQMHIRRLVVAYFALSLTIGEAARGDDPPELVTTEGLDEAYGLEWERTPSAVGMGNGPGTT